MDTTNPNIGYTIKAAYTPTASYELGQKIRPFSFSRDEREIKQIIDRPDIGRILIFINNYVLYMSLPSKTTVIEYEIPEVL